MENGSRPALSQQIQQTCQELGVTCIPVPDRHHENPNVACAYPIDWVVQNWIAKDQESQYSIIIDSDMFPVRQLSVDKFMADAALAGLPQRRGHVRYIWNGIVLWNHRRMLDWDQVSFHCSGCRGINPYFRQELWWGNQIEGQVVDVGGAMYFYLRDHPRLKVKYLVSTHHITTQRKNLQALPANILAEYQNEFRFELIEQIFFHYGRGSNWDNNSPTYHQRKSALMEKFLQCALYDQLSFPEQFVRPPYKDREFHYRQYLDTFRYHIKRLLKKGKP